jgi:hypothetical protein
MNLAREIFERAMTGTRNPLWAGSQDLWSAQRPPPGTETMNMRVVDERPGPGVEHGHDPDHASHIAWIARQFHKRRARRPA